MPLKINEDGTLPMWIDPATGRRFIEPAVESAVIGGGEGPGGPHTHAEADVTNLTADLAAKSGTSHNHAGVYTEPGHGHAQADVTNLVSDLAGKAPTHSHPYAATSHAHVDGDLPAGLARDAEVTSAIATHAATPHGGSLPAGLIVMWGGLIANIPAGWALCDGQNGTPDLRDRFIKGANGEAGGTGGAATHTHADHAALTHSGATVADHTLSGSIATENAHTHAYTQVVNHVHVQNAASSATGGLVGSTPDTSTNTSVASGYSTANPTGGVASGTTAGGSAHGHGNGTLAVSAHSVGQASQHAAQSHQAGSSEPAYYALCFIQKV